nr:hypothetical protein [Rhizobium leguminosarum]
MSQERDEPPDIDVDFEHGAASGITGKATTEVGNSLVVQLMDMDQPTRLEVRRI